MASKSGKSITTSVPTISIKFHANAEQIEELYGSDDEHKFEKKLAATKEKGSNSTGNIQDTTEGSPLKYLRQNKRSSSTEVTSVSDSSPPSDPWKFFTDIRYKIEEKFTEIKTRNQEEASPSKKARDNSSLSDSEELSESSLSKTCGVLSTTEGAEMSSDEEDSASVKNETPTNMKLPPQPPVRRYKLKSSRNVPKEGTVSVANLTKLCNINGDEVGLLPEYGDVESGVDALDEQPAKEDENKTMTHSESTVLKTLERVVDNIDIDAEGAVNVRDVGVALGGGVRTVFAPDGFVDFRRTLHRSRKNYLFPMLVLSLSITYLLIQRYSTYVAGMVAGIFVTSFSWYIMNQIAPLDEERSKPKYRCAKEIVEVPAVKEYQAIKYEGWLNEFPEPYNPSTYHITLTQPVYLRLQGNLLRISNSMSKVPKRAMWNESEIKRNFSHHRIYNLRGAKISLLPVGLAKIRLWSKKYPICVTLANDQLKFDDDAARDTDEEKDSSPSFLKKGDGFTFKKKTSSLNSPQRFSKLFAEQDNFYTDLDVSRSDNSSPVQDDEKVLELETEEVAPVKSLLDESPDDLKIYLFGRTDREKEDWFRRLCAATHSQNQDTLVNIKKDVSTESFLKDTDYAVYMSSIIKAFKRKEEEETSTYNRDVLETRSVSWLNAFLGRILFDCMCDAVFTAKIKDRIHRKLAAIRLPYFIEELSITELNLGKTSPLFKKIGTPTVDDRGLWVELSMTYEGLVVLTLMTKLNLMRLKQPPTVEKETTHLRSAIFHSDVDDSAESSSDDESPVFPSNPELSGTATPPVNKSKKLMKMVDRITESKIFQAATENKYIKRAMEGVSNTDLRLKVEVRALEGTLVLNIPPPPSDRLWIGFRPVPELSLSAHPIVGERNITFMHVTNWIERKLFQEFQKLLVIPNMEDIVIPVMMSKLPE